MMMIVYTVFFLFIFFFFFNDTATTEIYTLSLHDALPIYAAWSLLGSRRRPLRPWLAAGRGPGPQPEHRATAGADRKSTRLNSSHANISYAVFCLKKKKRNIKDITLISRVLFTC